MFVEVLEASGQSWIIRGVGLTHSKVIGLVVGQHDDHLVLLPECSDELRHETAASAMECQ